MLTPLAALLPAARRVDPQARFLFVGDYVNRGPEARGVIDLLLTLPNAAFVRGNHDDLLDMILHGICCAQEMIGKDRLAAFQWFMQHGLAETLLSYGASTTELERAMQSPSLPRLNDLIGRVPRAHRQFIRTLPLAVEEDGFFIVHAKWDGQMETESPGIRARLEGDSALRKLALWGRYVREEITQPKRWGRVGYFGHTPVDAYDPDYTELRPLQGEKMVLLDTAAALLKAGRLTAFCHETGRILQADRQGRVIHG